MNSFDTVRGGNLDCSVFQEEFSFWRAKASVRHGRERGREKQLREVPKTDARVGFFNEIQSVI